MKAVMLVLGVFLTSTIRVRVYWLAGALKVNRSAATEHRLYVEVREEHGLLIHYLRYFFLAIC